jgi:hypothetical protein
MTKTRLLLMMIALLAWPTQAHAARGFWGWLEELSGPGPFTGIFVTSVTVACQGGQATRLGSCVETRRDVSAIRRTFVIRIGIFDSGDGPRFSDLPETDADNQGMVRLTSFTGLYLFRLHPSLDIGSGLGFVKLSGERFDSFYKFVLTPMNASFTPFALKWPNSRYARLLRLELDNSFVPRGFTGADFNNARTKFDSGPEFLTRAAIVLDATALFW